MKSIVAAFIGLVALASSALATPLSGVPLPGGFFDSQYSAGSGANTAYFVVDFGMTGGGTYGFVYQWDGTQTADYALLAIDAAGAFDMAYDDFGSPGEPNLFISKLTYPPDSDQPDYNFDQRFWDYFLGDYTGSNVNWTESSIGISGRDFIGNVVQTLNDGGFYGLRADALDQNFNTVGGPPILPVAVPEPAAWVLTALGGLLVLGQRVRQRRLLLRDAVKSAQAPH